MSSSKTKRDHEWDPLKCKYEQPSPRCLLRLNKDITDFFDKPPAGLFISPDEDDVTKVHALVVGPAGTPYDGGFFQFLMKFPPDYPMSPPRVRIMTTDSGRVCFNPNLYADGKVCLSILGTWDGPAWSPAQGLESILVSIQSLLNENPYYNEPGTNPGRHNAAFARSYNDIIQHETMRVAVCDMVKASLNDSPQCPPSFRQHILKSFSESYDKYERVAKKNCHLTGTAMGALNRGVFDYDKLLERLKGLRTMVKTKVEGGAGQASQ